MKKLCLIFFVFLLPGLMLNAQSDTLDLSFEQALQKMNNNNLAIKGAEAAKKSNEFRRKTTRGLYMPRISFSASYLKFDQDIGMDISGLTDALGDAINLPPDKMLPSTLVLQKEQTATANINMIWPVFNGGKIRAVNRAMDATINEAQYKIDQTRSELNTELVQRYYGYRLSLSAVQLYEEVLDAMLLHQHNALKLEENGIISRAQRLYADLAVSMAKADLQNAVNQSNTVKDALKNTIADSSEINVVSELFLVKNIESLEYFRQSAIQNNFLLKQVDAKKQLAKQNYNLQKSSYFPSLAIVGNKEIANFQLTQLMPEWFVGVNLRWTIFDGISRTYKTQSAKATVDRVNFLEVKARTDISTYVTKLYNELLSYVEQLETLETTYEFASEYLRVQQRAFAEGFATSKDLVDAQTTVNKVKTGRLKIMNDYVVTLAKLLEVSGQSDLFLQYSKRPDREREDF